MVALKIFVRTTAFWLNAQSPPWQWLWQGRRHGEMIRVIGCSFQRQISMYVSRIYPEITGGTTSPWNGAAAMGLCLQSAYGSPTWIALFLVYAIYFAKQQIQCTPRRVVCGKQCEYSSVDILRLFRLNMPHLSTSGSMENTYQAYEQHTQVCRLKRFVKYSKLQFLSDRALWCWGHLREYAWRETGKWQINCCWKHDIFRLHRHLVQIKTYASAFVAHSFRWEAIAIANKERATCSRTNTLC
jgi:hypothetical protein